MSKSFYELARAKSFEWVEKSDVPTIEGRRSYVFLYDDGRMEVTEESVMAWCREHAGFRGNALLYKHIDEFFVRRVLGISKDEVPS